MVIFVIVLFRIFSAFSLLVLSGCSSLILTPAGGVAREEHDLFFLATILMLFVIVPVYILIVFTILKYRASNQKASYMPTWNHSILLESIWWFIPIVLIGVLAVITWDTTHSLDPYRPIGGGQVASQSSEAQETVEVVSLQWRWLFIYPKEGIATTNFLQLPIHTPIKFLVTADSPMNAFIVPQLAGQIYAMNGMRTKLYAIADKVGDYTGFSANYSGDGFSDMHFLARVTDREHFDAWVRTVKEGLHPLLTLQTYRELARPTHDRSVHLFSSSEPGLFTSVIETFRDPRYASVLESRLPTTKELH